MAEILVVDDDENICSAFQHFLKNDGHNPIIASNAEDGIKAVQERHPDIAFIDIRMPGVDGIEALRRIRSLDPNVYAIVMTAYSTSQTAIEAVRLGAFDYLQKPLDLDDVRDVIDKALAAQSLSRKAAAGGEEDWQRYSMVNLVGASPRMQEVYKLIGLLTTNDVPALILGERGSGKKLVAQTIHFNSRRKDKPFLMIECQTMGTETAEAELFGRAATTSTPASEGRLQKANGGTVFIDEIQYCPPACQVKLLRLLREKSYESVGGTETRNIDVRVIAGTVPDLHVHADHLFNADLYDAFRLITIELPRLRDRLNDIPELVQHFVRRHNAELHKNIRGVDERAKQVLKEYNWPGNVAELETVIKRACILARGDVLTVDDIREALERNASPLPAETHDSLESVAREALQHQLIASDANHATSVFYDIVGKVENALVLEALRITSGNQVKAAELLGINRTTLRKKMNLEGSET